MTDIARPSAILLATDLSARSDRATDRALQLAADWGATLVALTVLPQENSFSRTNRFLEEGEEPAEEDSPAAILERRLRQTIGDTDVPVQVRIGTGDVGANAKRVAEETGCGLIVTGLASSDVRGQARLGSSVLWLVRNSDMPVLVVHQRPRQAYRHIAVASDFSPAAADALRLADSWWPQREALTVVHGYDVPHSVMAANDARRNELLQVAAADADAEAREHLQEVLPGRDDVTALTALANPVRLARHQVDHGGAELLVMASHGRSRLMDKLVGSVAQRLLETANTDTLVVR
ncbi:MAG: universal stress protein [Pseudoxanthomonas suwonensis]|nr:universal stress protein [Pseudoxanthomonas suwonensis]